MSSNDLSHFKEQYEKRKPLNKDIKLKIANFQFTYKYEILGDFGIAMMAADTSYDINCLCDHPSIVLQRMNENYTPSNLIKSMISLANIANPNNEFPKFYWDYSDQSPLLLINLYIYINKLIHEHTQEDLLKLDLNGKTALENYWDFFLHYSKVSMKSLKFCSDKTKKKISKEQLENITNKIFDPVRKINKIDQIKDIIYENDNRLIRLKDEFNKLKEQKKEADDSKDEKKIKTAEAKLNDKKKEITEFIFDKPAFFYIFLFDDPHFGNVDWKDIPFETSDKIQHEKAVEAKSTYCLTSILFYHEEHYKLLIIHDSAILISHDGNSKDFFLPPKEDVIIISLTYSHVKRIDPRKKNKSTESKYNYTHYSKLYSFSLSSKNLQKEIYDAEYIPAFYSHFDSIKSTIDGFDLIYNYIRFPAFYSYNSSDHEINKSVENVIKYDVYCRSDEKIKQNIQHFIAKHALIPLWAISITKYLESKEAKDLQTSFLYILNEKFIISFTTYLYEKAQKLAAEKNKTKKSVENKNLQEAFHITFYDREKTVDELSTSSFSTSTEGFSNYNELFTTLGNVKVDREKIIYDLKEAINKFIEDNELGNVKNLEDEIKKQMQTYERKTAAADDDDIEEHQTSGNDSSVNDDGDSVNSSNDGDSGNNNNNNDDDDDDVDDDKQKPKQVNNNEPKGKENKYDITQDFLEYQKAIVKVHPYL